MAGKFKRRTDFPLVAILVFVEPDADRNLQAKLGSNRRNEFRPAC
jgi:hypothetical protein